ncbi:MAG: MarR family transcriptional regulator [Proteobacteria bacterium]|nr:MarR family transcriptional regulator [Pseudomonadota bacterium]
MPAAPPLSPVRRRRALAPIERVPGLEYGVLDELLGYGLRRAQVSILASFEVATRGLGITPPRFTALVIIGANPGLSQATLGSVLGIARSGAMMLVDWMVARGLVERRRKPGDGRTWGLTLTAQGARLLESMKRRVTLQERRRSAVLSTRERAQLVRLLEKLAG